MVVCYIVVVYCIATFSSKNLQGATYSICSEEEKAAVDQLQKDIKEKLNYIHEQISSSQKSIVELDNALKVTTKTNILNLGKFLYNHALSNSWRYFTVV